MRFLKEARRLVNDPTTSNCLRETLVYMLKNCIGHAKAKPISLVVKHLRRKGIRMSKEQFQHKILVPSRESDLFIGTCSKGIYLVKNHADTQPIIDFYNHRIESETAHRNQLVELRDAEWPE